MSRKLMQIVVDECNYRALKELGSAGESFNDVICRILKKVKPVETHQAGDSVIKHALGQPTSITGAEAK
jgi:hypothetical protein